MEGELACDRGAHAQPTVECQLSITALSSAEATRPIDWVMPHRPHAVWIHTSADGGNSWSPTGRIPGEAAALEITDDDWYAASSAGLFRSEDRGRTWTSVEVASP